MRVRWISIASVAAVIALHGQLPPPPLPEDSNWVALGFSIDAPGILALAFSRDYIYLSGGMELVGGKRTSIARVHRRSGKVEVLAFSLGFHPSTFAEEMWTYGDTLFIRSSVRYTDVIDTAWKPVLVAKMPVWSNGRWWNYAHDPDLVFMIVCGDTLYACVDQIRGLPNLRAELVKMHIPTGNWSIWGKNGRYDWKGWLYGGRTDGRRWIVVGSARDTSFFVDSVDMTGKIPLYDRQTGRWQGVPRRGSGLPVSFAFTGDSLWVGQRKMQVRGGEALLIYDLRRQEWVPGLSLPGVSEGDSITVSLAQDTSLKAVYALYDVWDAQGSYRGRYLVRWRNGQLEEIPLEPEMKGEGVLLGIYADHGELYVSGHGNLNWSGGYFVIRLPSGEHTCLARYRPDQRRWEGVVSIQGGTKYTYRPGVDAILKYGQDTLVVGGVFGRAGGKRADNLALLRISTMEFSPLVDLQAPSWSAGVYGNVYALAASGEYIYIGGSFTAPGGIRNVARYHVPSRRLEPLGEQGPDGPVVALGILGDSLFVGGGFRYVGGYYSPYVAIWDIRQQRWRRSGLTIRSIWWRSAPITRIVRHGNRLYIGGYGDAPWAVVGQDTGNFVVWDGNRWRLAVNARAYGVQPLPIEVEDLHSSPYGLLVATSGTSRLPRGDSVQTGIYIVEADTLRPIWRTPRTDIANLRLAVDTVTGEIFVGMYSQRPRESIARVVGDSLQWLGSGVQGQALKTVWEPWSPSVMLADGDR